MAKKRSPKQIAAFKKMIAALKRKRGKNPVKKKRRKVVKKRATKTKRKKTVKRKTVRRSNPSTMYFVTKGKSYYDGSGFSRSKSNAVYFSTAKAAKRIAAKLANVLGVNIGVHSTGKA